ncbi:MAG: response regulator [Leptolyngbya sp. DLM2.Bin15]|nr:MAG: response regulator [Leptolyngbya sp. DLM2.Bin15]
MPDSARILVVDDTPANLEIITEILANAGYTISTAISGDRALKRLQAYTPDLILLDVQMPGIDGFETCQRLKDNPETAYIPVIFMTAVANTSSKVKGFSLGAADYITKPFQESELLARVKTHLQLSLLTQQLEQRIQERTAELQMALDQLSRSQLKLIQSEKMASLGNLVAGVAHEINNPLGFLNGSIDHLNDYVGDLLDHLRLYQQNESPRTTLIQDHAHKISLDFLCEDLPKVLNSMQGATDRIRAISSGLRTFSRSDGEYKAKADLHEGIESALLILKYRIKGNSHRPAIQVLKDYGELPPIECFPGQLNQVFMNILANAIDVFDEAAQQASSVDLDNASHKIEISTAVLPESKHVEIRIRDNGSGMTPEVTCRIFDYLFTTKAAGKGTGLGLTIAHQIVTEKHNGSLHVQSEMGQGTEFCIRLPMS